MSRSTIHLLNLLIAIAAIQPLFVTALDCSDTPGNGEISYKAFCPSESLSGTEWFGGQQFSYDCTRWARTSSMDQSCAATVQECIEHCKLDSECRMSTWWSEGKKCFMIKQNQPIFGNEAGYVLLQKLKGDHNEDEMGDNAKLNTKALCPDFDKKEFFLQTPSNEKTKWRVYCDHRATKIQWAEQGVMNQTSTPYNTLLAHRHWDAGYRAFTWKDTDFSYTHLTVYNLPETSVANTLGRFYLQPAKGYREHVIARVDDTGLQFMRPL
ncbi:hypothetical protein CNMCM5793_002289 [Aspergillus hiratsukae]|uniref:Apple domain-containing protein n=1 Tax=Aspergillus hiratsukae TaxID=1194566 RepID=A0A8H6UU95_9EURO|nr:hypothetical protein CNMCM5793_002289 [Aspergillus hiratsukae]KAF7166180.1 hypothetical protein CNMCM6106_002104 [Aspergillus hiratsukae]